MYKRNSIRKYFTLILMFFTVVIGFSSWVIVGEKNITLGKAPSTRAVAYIVKDGVEVNYTSIEGALSKSVSGDIVHVILNITDPAIINYDCEIKSGVTLNIPYEKGLVQSETNGIVVATSTAVEIKNAVETNIVKIASGVTLTNNGTINIGGVLSGGSGECNYLGHTSGNYASLIMGQDSKIENYGTIQCCGYIKEEAPDNGSLLTLYENSLLSLPFIIRDFRGGSATYGIINSKKYICPFNTFELRNVQCKYRINYGANLYGYANIYAGDKHNPSKVYFVGDSNDSNTSFFELYENSYVDIKYDISSQKMKFDMYGGAEINSISLSLTIKIIVEIPVTISTKDFYFPVSYKVEIYMHKLDSQTSATYNASIQKFKIMPGGKIVVDKDVIFSSQNMNVYSYFNDCGTVPGTDYDLFRDTGTRMKHVPGHFEVNGKYTCNGSFGGQIIYGGSNENTDITITGSKTLTTNEAYSTSSTSLSDTFSITENYNLISLSTYKTKKQVVIGVTQITSVSNPTFNISYNGTTSQYSTNYVFYASNGETFKPTLLTNINKATFNDSYYYRDSTLTISDTNRFEINAYANGDVKTTSVTISGSDSVAVNSTTTLTASTGKYTTKFKWSSSDTTIATVDENTGKVKGVKMGTATISAVSMDNEQISGTKSIEVTDPTVLLGVSIAASKTSGGANTAYDTTIKVTLTPTSAEIASVTWNISDSKSILTLKTNTSDYNKTYTVAANSSYSDKTATISVTVVDIHGNSKTSNTITLTASKKESDICFAKGTLVTMADGSQKKIENIIPGEMIMSLNHETGKYESSKAFIKVNHGYSMYSVMKLKFSDKTELKLIGNHGLFDITLNRYVPITEENLHEFIGHEFLKYNDNVNINNSVKLISAEIIEEYTESYTIASEQNMNHIINGLVGNITTVDGIYNFFEFDSNFKYNETKMKEDIEKYGLYTYEEFSSYTTEYVFNAINMKYYKISVGKGIMTYEDVLGVLETYNALLENGELEQG